MRCHLQIHSSTHRCFYVKATRAIWMVLRGIPW